MKRVTSAALLAFFAVATSHAQLAQAIAAVITQDQATDFFAYADVTASSTTSQPKTLDMRSTYGSGGWLGLSAAPWMETGRHEYGGYVRVKWIGDDPPKLGSNYEATFDVWAIRAGNAHVTLFKSQPGPRSVALHASLMNFYLPLLNLDVSASSPGFDHDEGGDVPLGQIFSQALPTSQSSPPWNYMGNYVSSASFSWQTDGYYANVAMVGVTSFIEADVATAQNGWGPLDEAFVNYETRVVYKLVSVAGQPVN